MLLDEADPAPRPDAAAGTRTRRSCPGRWRSPPTSTSDQAPQCVHAKARRRAFVSAASTSARSAATSSGSSSFPLQDPGDPAVEIRSAHRLLQPSEIERFICLMRVVGRGPDPKPERRRTTSCCPTPELQPEPVQTNPPSAMRLPMSATMRECASKAASASETRTPDHQPRQPRSRLPQATRPSSAGRCR